MRFTVLPSVRGVGAVGPRLGARPSRGLLAVTALPRWQRVGLPGADRVGGRSAAAGLVRRPPENKPGIVRRTGAAGADGVALLQRGTVHAAAAADHVGVIGRADGLNRGRRSDDLVR